MLALLLAASLSVAASPSFPVLFLQPSEITDATGVRMIANPPESSSALIPANPEQPDLWYSPSGAYDTGEGVLVWYQRVEKSQAEYMDQRALCAGLVRDGQMSPVKIDETSPAWGGVNNVVMRRSPHEPTWGGFNVFQVARTGDVFSMLYWDQPEKGSAGAMLATSADGLSWTKDPRGAVFTELNDAFTLVQVGSEYLLYQTMLVDWPSKPYEDNLPGKRRVVCLRKSNDLVTWSGQEVLLTPDELDRPETEFYLMKAFPCAGRFLGFLMKYYADPAKPGAHSALTETELVVSDDGRNWQRPFRDSNLGFWTYATPFAKAGNLAFVAGQGGGMSLLQYRPSRMTGVKADGEGEFTTGVIALTAANLAVDADTRNGSIEVELLNEDGEPVGGFGPCLIEGVDDPQILLDWENFTSATLPLERCRLRISLDNATIYAVRNEGE